MAGQFRAAGAEILVIMADNIAHVCEYAERLRVPFPVLSDPEREVYHRYELEKEFLFVQRTASAIVDRDGVIRYLKRATNPMLWREESAELLDAVKQLPNGPAAPLFSLA
jgi:peroxiredoxin